MELSVSLTDEEIDFILCEVAKLNNKYDGLHLKLENGRAFLIGELNFTATWLDETISDSYQIKIEFPQNYPDIPPMVEETGDRLPKNVDNHIYEGQFLCLGPPLKVLLKFREEPTILNFVETSLIPTRYWHSHRKIHPTKPLPAYSHGDGGIREYHNETNLKEDYFKILKSDNINVVLLLIKMIIDDTYKKSNPKCPCKKGRQLKDCHGKNLQLLLDMPYMKKYIGLDYDKMFQEAKERGEIDDIRPFSQKKRSRQVIRKKK